MEKHVQIVGILNIACGALGVLIGILLFVVLVGVGIMSGDYEAMSIMSIIGTALAGFFLILSIPSIIGGIFLLKRANWARVLILIISVLNLFNIPFGTALGAYSLWALLNADENNK